MPKIYQRKAKTDRYNIGQKTPAENKQGYVIDFSKPNMNAFNEFELDRLICKKGETYFTWHPKGQPWRFSKERPIFAKQKSEWEEKLEEFDNAISDLEYGSDDDNIDEDEQESNKDAVRTSIEDYRDELQGRLDNMPQQLQENHILTERISELQELIDSIN